MSYIRTGSTIVLLSFLAFSSTAEANLKKKGRTPSPPATSIKKAAISTPVSRQKRPTKIVNPKKQISKSSPISNRLVIKRADSSVIEHLTSALMDRGPQGKRLDARSAKALTKKKWRISDTKILSKANAAQHPITGSATIAVKVERIGGSNISKIFRTKRRREYIVNIDSKGTATVIGERSDAVVIKTLRAINDKLAITRIFTDLLHSSGVRTASKNLGLIVLGIGTTSSLAEVGALITEQAQSLGPAILTAASYSASGGVRRRTEARFTAFEKLTTTLDGELKAGNHIELEVAYQRYATLLKEVKIGTKITSNVKAPSRELFVQSLAAWELTRALPSEK